MSKYKDLNDFLIKHNANKETPPTHTRIGDKQYQGYGGSFSIPVEDESQFYRHFYDKVFFKGQSEYLTEKQLCDGCSPIAVDFDFRYDPKIESRQHTPEHVQDIVMLYLEELKGFYTFGPDAEFPVYVMEKPNVNMVADKGVTKDGIHMIIGVQSDHVQQQMIRERVLAKLPDVWDGLPITNSWAEAGTVAAAAVAPYAKKGKEIKPDDFIPKQRLPQTQAEIAKELSKLKLISR